MGCNTSKQSDKRRKYGDSTDGCPAKNKPNNCKNKSYRKGCKNHRVRRTTNPFILFYLLMRKTEPKKPITEVARSAGKIWVKMTTSQKEKYINLANAEKKRRMSKGIGKKKKC